MEMSTRSSGQVEAASHATRQVGKTHASTSRLVPGVVFGGTRTETHITRCCELHRSPPTGSLEVEPGRTVPPEAARRFEGDDMQLRGFEGAEIVVLREAEQLHVPLQAVFSDRERRG